MRARDELLALLEALVSLLEETIARADENIGTVMSCFTHLQPAQPSTFGHYLAGVGAELSRSAEWLASVYDVVNCSPMGAAAGAGTSFPIDREQVARYLGFARVVDNSVDAVASRDYLIQMLSTAAMTGTTLTRLSNDLQHWASHAYGFLIWPDDAELISTRLEGILTAAGHPLQLDRVAVAAVLDPEQCMQAARYGGGPAPASVRDQMRALESACSYLRERTEAWRRQLADADHQLAEAACRAAEEPMGRKCQTRGGE